MLWHPTLLPKIECGPAQVAAHTDTNSYTDTDLLLPQLNRQLGGSMPNCASNSTCSSRRSSRGSCSYNTMGGGGGSGGAPPGRRSSGGSTFPTPTSAAALPRRESSGGFFDSMMTATSEQTSSSVGTSPLAAAAAAAAAAGSSPGKDLLQSIGSGVVGAVSFSSFTPPRYRKTFLSRPFNNPTMQE